MQALQDATYRKITDLMCSAIGLSLPESKKPLVSSRLSSRIQRLGLDGFEAYFALISGDQDGAECQMAVDLLTINETYFVREPAHYDLLERALSATKPRSLAVWRAAASFGDEACSTAMLLAELAQMGRIGSDWQILGTDISDRVLTQLRPNGLFFIGTAEGRGPCDTALKSLAPGAFRKVAG